MLTFNRSRKFFTFLIGISVLLVYLYSSRQVHRYLENTPSTERAEAFILSPAFLEIAAGEFKGLMGDYLILKGVSFLGGRYDTTESDLDAIQTLFKQSLTLDPYFLQTCYLTQAYIAWQGKRAEAAIELLEISNKYRDWDWNPGFFIGFDYFYFLNNNLAAAEYLMEVSKKPGAGTLPALLASRLSQKGGETQTSILFMKSMLDTIEDDVTRKQFEMRLAALEGVYIIERAITVFKSRFNRPPDDLGELVTSKILEKLPDNPYKKPFTLEDGIIVF
jgi:hypothetical protein